MLIWPFFGITLSNLIGSSAMMTVVDIGRRSQTPIEIVEKRGHVQQVSAHLADAQVVVGSFKLLARLRHGFQLKTCLAGFWMGDDLPNDHRRGLLEALQDVLAE